MRITGGGCMILEGGKAVNTNSLKPDVGYLKDLVEAGLEGINSGWKTTEDRSLAPSFFGSMVPAALGCGIGVLSTWLVTQRRGAARVMTVGGVIGSTLGFGIGFAWASRRLAGTVYRSAARKVNTVRDAHWLEKHPIAYG